MLAIRLRIGEGSHQEAIIPKPPIANQQTPLTQPLQRPQPKLIEHPTVVAHACVASSPWVPDLTVHKH
eukprot:3929719-Rhodomonas_salina.1